MKTNVSNPVVWFEIYVQDMERAKAFYEAVFAAEGLFREGPGAPCLAANAKPLRQAAGHDRCGDSLRLCTTDQQVIQAETLRDSA